MCQSLIELLMHQWLEGFDDDLDAQVVIAVEHLPGIYLLHHQAPFLDIDDLVSEWWKLHMAVILPEFVDAIPGEHGFQEVMAVWYQDIWDVLNDDESHCLAKQLWKSIVANLFVHEVPLFDLLLHVTIGIQKVLNDTKDLGFVEMTHVLLMFFSNLIYQLIKRFLSLIFLSFSKF